MGHRTNIGKTTCRDYMTTAPRTAQYAFTAANELRLRIANREISSRELTEFYLERIRRFNPSLRAIVAGNEAGAVRTAIDCDRELSRGTVRSPLHGIPVTVKEAFDIRGLPTTVNFQGLKNNVASSDSFVVEQLKAAGAIILGKTNVPTMLADYQTFGPLYATANNPHDLARTPGGSTGGGAAAVAAGLTTIEIGSDLAGSIRVPAHFCGVYGLKPTENLAVHGAGHVPPPPNGRPGFVGMASVGPLARTMDDIELAWTALSGSFPQKERVNSVLADYRVAWFDDVGTIACGIETKRALRSFVRVLQASGAAAEERPFDEQWLDSAYAVWTSLMGTMVGQHVPWIVRQVIKFRFGGTSLAVAAHWRRGLALRIGDFNRALGMRAELIRDLDGRFREFDFIVSPVAAGPAFPHNRRRGPIDLDGRTVAYLDYAMPFTAAYNACGNPALVVPAGRSTGGLPIGIQIAAPRYAEPELIHFGKLVEQLGFGFRPPAGY